MSRHDAHIADAALISLIDDELAASRRRDVEAHLATCARCRARLEELQTAAETALACAQDEMPPAGDARAMRTRIAAQLSDAARVAARTRARTHTLTRISAAAAAIVAAVLLVRALPSVLRPMMPLAGGAASTIGADDLPRPNLTPGATRVTTAAELCAEHGDASAPIPIDVRRTVVAAYGVETLSPREYELDYLVTPDLGGTADARNLWPERYSSPVWNARVKDQLEDLLPTLVCNGAPASRGRAARHRRELDRRVQEIFSNGPASCACARRSPGPARRRRRVCSDRSCALLRTTGISSGPPPSRPQQQLPQRLGIDGLHEMFVEARVAALLTIGILPPAGDGDEQRGTDVCSSRRCSRNFVSAHARQADVEQHDVRLERLARPRAPPCRRTRRVCPGPSRAASATASRPRPRCRRRRGRGRRGKRELVVAESMRGVQGGAGGRRAWAVEPKTRTLCPARRCGPRSCRRASRRAAAPASGRCPVRPGRAPRSPRMNSSKMRGSRPGSMPRPVSATRIVTVPSPASAVT